MFLILCELVVHFCVGVSLQKSDNANNIRQPLGLQMCVELCSTFDGCQSPKYDSVLLRCTLDIATVKSRICGDVQPSTKTCTIMTGYLRTIHARNKGLRKVTRIWKVSRVKKVEIKGTSLAPRPSRHLTIFTTTGNPLRLTTSEKKEGATCPAKLAVSEQNITLHQACNDGKLCVIKFILLQHPADIDIRDKLGRTPVMAAAQKGQVAVFDALVGYGCDLSLKDGMNYTVLHVACGGGNVDIVRKLVVNQKCDVEIKARYGLTPMMVSVLYGFINVFDLLESIGCDVTAIGDDMNNILHVACMGGHVDMVKYILSKEIYDIESKGEMGRTSVLIAAYYGHREVVRLLMTYGCKQSAVDDSSDNILHVTCLGGHVDMVKDILTLNITNIESRGQYRETPVIRAAGSGQIAVVDFLVKKGCNLKAVNDYMSNILHVACSGGHVDMVKHILLHYKFDIDSRGKYGRTPVMFAAYFGGIEVAKLLVAKGCNIEKVDSQGDNILHLACQGGHVDMVKHILSMKTFSIDSRGEDGRTAVMYAAIAGHTGVLKYLGIKGSQLTVTDSRGNNILHLACFGGHVNVVKYVLLVLKINMESRDQRGMTPVMLAAWMGKKRVFDFLVSQGSKLTVVDTYKNNLLHLACMGGNTELVKHLLTLRHAERMRWARNNKGKTPLKIAEQKRNAGVVALLKGGM